MRQRNFTRMLARVLLASCSFSPGVETIDVTGIDSSFLKHSFFGTTDVMLNDIFNLGDGALRARWLVTLACRLAGSSIITVGRRDDSRGWIRRLGLRRRHYGLKNQAAAQVNAKISWLRTRGLKPRSEQSLNNISPNTK